MKEAAESRYHAVARRGPGFQGLASLPAETDTPPLPSWASGARAALPTSCRHHSLCQQTEELMDGAEPGKAVDSEAGNYTNLKFLQRQKAKGNKK